MERYLAYRRCREEALCGRVNLRYGTTAVVTDGALTLEDGRRVCFPESAFSHQYFVWDGDGNGRARGTLVKEIRRLTTGAKQSLWDRLWDDEGANRLRRQDHRDHWLWGHALYQAPVEELARILKLIKEAR